jgi:hypothetical protein
VIYTIRGGRFPRDFKKNEDKHMKLDYNVTGAERKSLAGAISQYLNAPTKYLGAPTFAYEIGGYHIDKTGTVTGPDNRDLMDALADVHGLVSLVGEFDDEADCESGSHPDNASEPNALTIEMPMEGFTPEAIDRLCRMVTAKEPLLRAALDTDDLPISVSGDNLTFPWFYGDAAIDADHAKAYATLISLLCKTAKEKKRVTAKEKAAPENPKYAMRCFLLSIGMIGGEYKAARKILLSRLEGNSSWKTGRKAEE